MPAIAPYGYGTFMTRPAMQTYQRPDAMNSRPILIVATSLASFALLRELAARLARQGQAIAFCSQGDNEPLDAAMRAAAEAMGTRLHCIAAHAGPATVWQRTTRRLSDGNAKLNALLEIHQVNCRAARQLLREVQPKAVVVAEDGISGNCWIIDAARRAGVPVVDCPYGYGTHHDLENHLASRQQAGELLLNNGAYAEEIRRKYPHWIKRGRFEGALLYVPEYIVAWQRAGLRIRDPWVVHGGVSDKLCVESPQMLRHYLAEGLPRQQLELTGTVYCDMMHDALGKSPSALRALHSGQKIEPGTTSILVCWPTSYHADRGALCEFESYVELSQRMFQFLSSLEKVQVTVSLHPAMPTECRQVILDCPVQVSETNVLELIPQHDMYISEFSSTVRWAIAAGKPVVNYDFYCFDLCDYDEAPGVLQVSTFQAFQDEVRALVRGEAHYAAIAKRQCEVAEEWGVIDGKAAGNIAALIDSLTSKQRGKAFSLPRLWRAA